MRKLLLVLAVLTLAIPAYAQGPRSALFVADFEADSGTLTYCVTTGQNEDPYGPPRQGQAPINTSGSSTTVTAVTAGTNPFALVTASATNGDMIFVQTAPGTVAMRHVTAKASSDSITVNSAIDLSAGFPFTWKKVTCGTASTSGWIDVSAYADVDITFKINQMNATSIDVLGQCEHVGVDSAPTQVFPPSPVGAGVCDTGNFTAAMGSSCTINISSNSFDRCRIGFKVNVDDGDDLTTNAEDITAGLAVRVRQ